ncbi:winged helix-turn-helix domain-containing protein [Streptomyces sp. NPDC058695]|uniref:helix-turn-helix domain-containing protein n=1 Tax=Streptomyces sp. NPDC058695 TaxID=3346604 RepID=UPI0036552A4C
MLGKGEQDAVRQAVLENQPCDVGLSGQLWTRRLVGELIAKLYPVRLTGPGAVEYPRRWGLSFQRPGKRAVEQDPEVVRRWHGEAWPAIRAKARRDGAARCCSPNRSVSAPIKSPAAPGVRRAGPRWCGAAGTGSR